jgi:hypothetical protein
LTQEEIDDLADFDYGKLVTYNSKIKYYPSNPFLAINASSKFFLQGLQAVNAGNVSTGGGQSSVSILGTLRLSWTITAEGVINFVFESNSTGWFGFGLGSNMMKADIYFCRDTGNGTFTVDDTWRYVPVSCFCRPILTI